MGKNDDFLTNEELATLRPVGTRIVECVNGWQTTILVEGARGRVREDTCPLRPTQQLARADAERVMPGIFEYAIVRLCQRAAK